ncbi:unnamed protein product [Cuscuta epithymum]|uniref:Uncharacterized protein n=1 Tax=Cuscuta epithymum TaxID=186058 RepID=A0AAV0E635_9ASTE|nr:unnamed protein product [Cuscuta epithymum]
MSQTLSYINISVRTHIGALFSHYFTWYQEPKRKTLFFFFSFSSLFQSPPPAAMTDELHSSAPQTTTTPPSLPLSTQDIGPISSAMTFASQPISPPSTGIITRPPPSLDPVVSAPFSPYAAAQPYSLFNSLPPQFPWQSVRQPPPPTSAPPPLTTPPASPFCGPSFAGFPRNNSATT